MNNRKKYILAAVIVTVAGFAYIKSSHRNIPSDFRDAVAGNAESQDFDTAIPVFKTDTAGKAQQDIGALTQPAPAVVFKEVDYRSPVKLDVAVQSNSVKMDQWLTVKITLLDPDNQPAKIGREMEISLEARKDSEVLGMMKTAIRAGDTSKEIRLKLNVTGIIFISAKNRELRDGGTYIKIK